MRSLINKFSSRKDDIFIALFGLFFLIETLYCYSLINEYQTASYILFGLFAFGLTITAVIYHLLKSRIISFEVAFLLCLLALGLIYIFLFGPLKAPDEKSHFTSAYWYSNVFLGCSNPPFSMRYDDYELFKTWREASGSYSGQFELIEQELSLFASNPELIPFEREPGFSFFGSPAQLFLPGSLGITLGRLLGLGALPTYYLGRITALAIFATAAFFSVKHTPIGKPVYVVVALLPITLELATSYSYDGPTIAIAMMLSAFCFKAILSDNLEKSTLAVIAIFSVLIVPCKVVYSTIALLVLLIPNNKFASKRFAYAYKAGVFILMALFLFLTRFQNVVKVSGIAQLPETGTQAPSYYTFSDLVQDPLQTVQIFVVTFFTKTQDYILSLFGGSLGALNLVPSYVWPFVIAFALLLLVALFAKSSDIQASSSLKIVCLIGFIVSALGFHFAMMTGWTPKGYTYIEGVQGRYFIPALFLLVPFFNNSRLSLHSEISKPLLCCTAALGFLYANYVYMTIIVS